MRELLLRRLVRTSVIRAAAVFCASIAALSGAFAQEADNAYRLMPGDQISVTLPLNPELNAAGPIGPDGRFSLPLGGRLQLSGLSAESAEALIARTLREAGIVADARPNVTVTLFAAAVYVGGEVRNPGSVALLKAPNAMQAVILAGGTLDTARSKRVVIITPATVGPARIRVVDLKAYTRRGDASVDRPLTPGEIVFVPKSTIAEVNLWIDQHVNRIIPSAAHFNYNVGGAGQATTTITP
jgi:protein involved in polysaccharide export with SLBB domain